MPSEGGESGTADPLPSVSSVTRWKVCVLVCACVCVCVCERSAG